jgi:hypothetical protein
MALAKANTPQSRPAKNAKMINVIGIAVAIYHLELSVLVSAEVVFHFDVFEEAPFILKPLALALSLPFSFGHCWRIFLPIRFASLAKRISVNRQV